MRVVLESEMSKQDLGVIHEWVTLRGWTKDPDSALGYMKQPAKKNLWVPNAVAACLVELSKDLEVEGV